jgi:hypothetical protein
MKSIQEIENYIEVYDSNIYDYVNKHKLIKHNNVLFLSNKYFYYYDKDEMKTIKTIVFLKKLNEIKDLNDTVRDLYDVLNKNSIFCGKFIDNKYINNVLKFNKYNKLFEILYNLIDERNDRLLSIKIVTTCLNTYNFKILNMSEINGVTYFHAKKI